MSGSEKSPLKFENLMHSVMDKAKAATIEHMDMGGKVDMVDNLVDLFIKGNENHPKKTAENGTSQQPIDKNEKGTFILQPSMIRSI